MIIYYVNAVEDDKSQHYGVVVNTKEQLKKFVNDFFMSNIDGIYVSEFKIKNIDEWVKSHDGERSNIYKARFTTPSSVSEQFYIGQSMKDVMELLDYNDKNPIQAIDIFTEGIIFKDYRAPKFNA